MTGIQLLTFDLDNTLWDNEPVIERAEQQLYQWLQQYCPRLVQRFGQQALIEQRMQLLKEKPELASSISELRIQSLQIALEQSGYSSSESQRLSLNSFRFFLNARNQVTLFEGAREALQVLAKNYTIGALTNGNVELENTPAANLFDFHINAEIAGERKPGSRQFEMAMEKSGINSKHCIHIGDHPLDDIIGASRLGIPTLWFNRKGLDWDKERFGEKPANCRMATNWKDIPAVIKQIANNARSQHTP